MAIRATRTRRIYPYLRADASLADSAIRLGDSTSAWNPTERKLLIEGHGGENVEIDARIALNIPELRTRALAGKTPPTFVSIIARCARTRWAIELERLPIKTSSDFPFEETRRISIPGEYIA